MKYRISIEIKHISTCLIFFNQHHIIPIIYTQWHNSNNIQNNPIFLYSIEPIYLLSMVCTKFNRREYILL